MKRFKTGLPISFFSMFLLGVLVTSVWATEEQRRQITLPPSIPKVEKLPAAGLPPQIPQVPKVWDTSVVETQRQLEDIIRTHQILQMEQQTQLREIQRITEQARIHQKILNELKTAGQAGGGGTTVEEAIRVQKVALIQEETRKNRLRLRRLQRKAAREKTLKRAVEEKEAPAPPPTKTKKSPWEELFKTFGTQRLPFSSQKEEK